MDNEKTQPEPIGEETAATEIASAESTVPTENEAAPAPTSDESAPAPTSGQSAPAPTSEESAPAPTSDESASPAEDTSEADAHPSNIEDLKPGMRLQGRVRNLVEFGAFIDVGVGRDGLAHISTLKRAGVEKSLSEGDVIDVQIRRVDLDRNRISLTIPGAGRGNKKSLKELEVGALVPGRVVRVVDFGAFVDVGAQTDGLLHISEITDGYVNHPTQVVNVGDDVEVRILEVDTDRKRISLSMKGMDVEVEEAPRTFTAAQEEDVADDSDMPTAFQVAWESAVRERKQRRRRG